MKKIICLFTVALIFTKCVTGQVQQSGWLASFNTFRLDNRFSIHFDAQWRGTDNIKNMQTALLRTGLNYKPGKNSTFTAGYAFISNRRVISGISGYAPEHRLWEQLIVHQKIKNLSVSHRFRLEQRFISKSQAVNNELVHEGSVYASRIRYFIRTIIPLAKEKEFSKGLFGAVQNEVFLNFGNRSVVNGKYFDQNRLYLALGYKLSARLSFDAGYMNHYVNGRNNSFTNTHIIQLAAYTQL